MQDLRLGRRLHHQVQEGHPRVLRQMVVGEVNVIPWQLSIALWRKQLRVQEGLLVEDVAA